MPAAPQASSFAAPDFGPYSVENAVFRHVVVTRLSSVVFDTLRAGSSVLIPHGEPQDSGKNAVDGALEIILRLGLTEPIQSLQTECAEVVNGVDSNELGLEDAEQRKLQGWLDEALHIAGIAFSFDEFMCATHPSALLNTTSAVAALALAFYRTLAAVLSFVRETPPDDPSDAGNLVGDVARVCTESLRLTQAKGRLGFDSPTLATDFVCDQFEKASRPLTKKLQKMVVEWVLADFKRLMSLWTLD